MDEIEDIVENVASISLDVNVEATVGKEKKLMGTGSSEFFGRQGAVFYETWRNENKKAFQLQNWFFIEENNSDKTWGIRRVIIVGYRRIFEEVTDLGLIEKLRGFNNKNELIEDFKRVFEFAVDEKLKDLQERFGD